MNDIKNEIFLGGPASEEELLSESTQTLPADRSMSSCSQGIMAKLYHKYFIDYTMGQGSDVFFGLVSGS